MIYKIANREELELIWDRDIQNNLNDDRYLHWKEQFIENNLQGNCITFIAVDDVVPVGQITLLHKPSTAMFRRTEFCSNGAGYVMAVRIEKPYEGKGHISKLFQLLNDTALYMGLESLVVGAETSETRTISIYQHLGFTECIGYEESEKVIWYRKKLICDNREITSLIGTERLILKPYSPEQATVLAETLNNFEIARWTNLPFPYENEYAVAWIEQTLKDIESQTGFELAVIIKDTNELIGTMSVMHIDKRSKVGELGYWIKPDKQGYGYATEAGRAIIDFAFNELKLHKVIGRCLSDNIASKQVMQKCGLTIEGEAKSQILQYGEYKDMTYLGITKDA